jgi:hypothetical protein
MRPGLPLCLLVLAAVVAAADCRRPPPPAPPAPPPTRPLVEVQAVGEVWRARPGAPREPLAAGPLMVGETLSTGPDGKAIVRLPHGRQIELGPNGRLHLSAGPDGRVAVEIEAGIITSRTVEDGVALDIRTPFGITRVSAAGEVSVDVGAIEGRIAVAVGTVIFVDRNGREITAHADETILVSLGRVEVVRPGPAPARPDPPVDVMLAADQGRLLVRRPGEPRFSPRRALPAPAGTLFEVAPEGKARLLAGGVRARLGPGAAGRVGGASRAPDGLRLALGLDRGAALLTFEGAGKDQLLLGDPAAPVVVRIDEPTTISVVSGRHGPTLTVLAGAADVSVGESRQHLDSSVLAQVTASGLRALPRRQSDVILPTARGLRVYADRLREVTLSWPAALGQVTVEVAEDPDFKDLITAGRTATGWVTVPAPSRADLHWRVTARNGGVERVLIGQARFAPDRRRSVLDLERPRNLVTETEPVTTVYFQSALPALTFAFAARPGAERYRLRVYRDDQLAVPVVDKVVTDTHCAVDATPLHEGRYVWHAVGLDGLGRELGTGGRMNKLELTYDNALTTLAIGTPRPGEPVTGPRVDASGVAPLGSKLYINGQPAPLDAKGRFAVSLESKPALVFRLVGRDGVERYWVRRLRVRS